MARLVIIVARRTRHCWEVFDLLVDKVAKLDWSYFAIDPSVMGATSAVLAGEIDVGMNDAHMPSKRVVARERLLLDTKRTSDFLFADVVNRILVPGQVVRTREDGGARLAGGRVDAIALVRARLGVPRSEIC